ncbi:MAG: hypothetical protein ACYC4R_09980 [Anaerolineae bacterium]
MSPRALVYDERPLAHRFIVLYEASGLGQERPGEVNDLAYMMRSLLSEGLISYTTVDCSADGPHARTLLRKGPTGLITTTTWGSLHAENETRLFSLTVRDDREQTRAVFGALADRANGHRAAPVDLATWHALQTWLELGACHEVTIPFAHRLAAGTHPTAVRLRRDFGRVLVLIQAHALLHQANRQRDAQGRIIATVDDYAAVYKLVVDLVAEGVEMAVSPTVREAVEAVRDLQTRLGRPVGMRDLAEQLGIDRTSANRRARVAIEAGYLVNREDRRGKPAQLEVGAPLPEEEAVLPSPVALYTEGILLDPPADRLHTCTGAEAR